LIQEGKADQSTVQKVAPRIYYGRGVELINDLQYAEADKMLAAVSSFKSSLFYPPSLFWRGEIASRNDQFQLVIKFTQEFLKTKQNDFGPANDANANYNLGYSYLDLEDYKSAAIHFERIMLSKLSISNDFRREATLRLADCFFMQKNVEKARMLYQSITLIFSWL
jgi:TolA-binding protein